MDETRRYDELLWFICREVMRLVEIELERFSAALEEWIYDLFAERLPADWQQHLHAYLDAWDDEFEVLSEHRAGLITWIESWAEARGLLPIEGDEADGSGEFLAHSANRNAFYRLPPDSGLTTEDAFLALELAKASYELRRVIAFKDAVRDDPGLLRRINDALNPFADGFKRQLELSLDVFDLQCQLFDIETTFRCLGYDRIEWREFNIRFGTGIDAAEMVSQAGPPHGGMRSVFVEDVMTASGLAGLSALATRALARAGARLTQRGIRFVLPTETIRDEATRLVKNIVDEELAKLSANPQIAQIVLRRRELMASVDPRIARMQFGRALERLVGQRIERDRVFQTLFEYHGQRAGPDFFGMGRFHGLRLDITTPGEVAKHLARPYGEDMIIITYTRPIAFP